MDKSVVYNKRTWLEITYLSGTSMIAYYTDIFRNFLISIAETHDFYSSEFYDYLKDKWNATVYESPDDWSSSYIIFETAEDKLEFMLTYG
jgi:hypothetical protein